MTSGFLLTYQKVPGSTCMLLVKTTFLQCLRNLGFEATKWSKRPKSGQFVEGVKVAFGKAYLETIPDVEISLYTHVYRLSNDMQLDPTQHPNL